jgi:hypothetical protein
LRVVWFARQYVSAVGQGVRHRSAYAAHRVVCAVCRCACVSRHGPCVLCRCVLVARQGACALCCGARAMRPRGRAVCGPRYIAAWAALGGSPVPRPRPPAVLGVWSARASATAGTQLGCCGWRFRATTGPARVSRVLCSPGVRASVWYGQCGVEVRCWCLFAPGCGTVCHSVMWWGGQRGLCDQRCSSMRAVRAGLSEMGHCVVGG